MRHTLLFGVFVLLHGYPGGLSQHIMGKHLGGKRFGGFSQYDSAMSESNSIAQSRQSQSQASQFQTPSFQIPFQANFAFNDFPSSPFGASGNFPEFLSNLGGQELSPGSSPFIQDIEQRFRQPQAATQSLQRLQSRSSAGRSQPLIERPQPVYRRPEPVYTPPTPPPTVGQFSSDTRNTVKEDKKEAVSPPWGQIQPVYTQYTVPQARDASQEQHMFRQDDFSNMDFETDFNTVKLGNQESHRMENRNFKEPEKMELEVVEDISGEKQSLQERSHHGGHIRNTHEQDKHMFDEQEKENMKYQQQLEESKKLKAKKIEKYHEKKMDFKPPSIIEKFKKPVVKSERLSFDVESPSSRLPAKLPVQETKPGYKYNNQQMREKGKYSGREEMDRQAIRIKPKHQSASPRPSQAKQLSLGGGFQPYRPPIEVSRPEGIIREPVYDNDQVIITAPRVRKEPSSGSFSVDVKASFAPLAKPEGVGRRKEGARRRNIHQEGRGRQYWREGKGMELPFLVTRGEWGGRLEQFDSGKLLN